MKVYVLYENGSDGKQTNECIKGVTTKKELAIGWADKDSEYREFDEFDLDEIHCQECEGEWKIEKYT